MTRPSRFLAISLLTMMGLLPTSATAETQDPGAEALFDVAAAAADDTVEASAVSGVDAATSFNPEAAAGPSNTGVAPASAEPQWAPPPPGMFCDNAFANGDMGNCPVAVAEVADAAPDQPSLAEVEAAILAAFQSLTVAPSVINYQPDGTWAAVNMDFIVYTDRNRQVLSTTIFEVPVTFTVEPVHWTWDFGDGSTPLQTSSIGAPYPNQTVSHVYTASSEGVTVSVTTLWSGTFTVADDPTAYPVNGFVTTTTSAGPIEIVAFDVVLVPNPGES